MAMGSTMSEQANNFPATLTPVVTSINNSMQKMSSAYAKIINMNSSYEIKNKTYIIPIVMKAVSDAFDNICTRISQDPANYLLESNI
jgi:hypothetical protein